LLGFDPPIQDILDHGSPVTTKLIYVEVAEDLHRDVLSSPSSRQVRSTADTSVA
jgi:hypothetical protein